MSFKKDYTFIKNPMTYLPCTHTSIRIKEHNQRLGQAVDANFVLHHIPFLIKSLKFVKSVEV